MKLKDKEKLKRELLRRNESKEDQRKRIALAIAAEVKQLQETGMPNESIGLLIYNKLVDERCINENLQLIAGRLALQLNFAVNEIIEDAKATETPKSC